MSAIYVRAKNPWNAQEQLDAAESRLRLEAMESRAYGIMIKKICATHYMVELSERVPYGSTHEESAE